MSETTKQVLKTIWEKISTAILKSFRGLLCEKKEGGWELSKGNVAFLMVFSHCMYVWHQTVFSASTAPVEEGVLETVNNVAVTLGVPDQEYYLLLFLLGYSAIKATKGGITNALGALRGGK